jgi:hypothetical protein
MAGFQVITDGRFWVITEAPGGLDVTAYVLDKIGQSDFESDVKATKQKFETAKQNMGKLISQEILPEMFSGVEPLELVKVDEKRWPNLAKWVSSYTQHRVGKRKV